VQIDKNDMLELGNIVASAVVEALEKRNLIGNASASENPKTEKTAYQKTEQLLYNYTGFQKIKDERLQEIEELRVHGVPQKCGGVNEYVDKGGMPQGITLPEEATENAIRNVEASIAELVGVINMIDKCLYSLRNDPYYKIIELRYFEGRTQEDIALTLKCSQVTISNNKNRLVREMALRLFPNQVIKEYLA